MQRKIERKVDNQWHVIWAELYLADQLQMGKLFGETL